MSVHLSLTHTHSLPLRQQPKRDLNTYTKTERSVECSSASRIHLLGNYLNIFKRQQYSSVSSHAQGGVKMRTSWPAGWLWSRMSGCALLCSSQSVVGDWLQAHGYKAGTVTKVTWLSEEKAAWPEFSLLLVCLPSLRQYTHTELEEKHKKQRDVHCTVHTERKSKNMSLLSCWLHFILFHCVSMLKLAN